MNKILTLSILIFLSFLNFGNSPELKAQDKTEYEKNLNIASELYLEKKKIPESILIKLVPENDSEFGAYYATTGPDHKMGETDFFYETTRLIFEKVTSEKIPQFYLPSLNLASYADGEYAEEFLEYLELIINSDKEKFCNSLSKIKHKNRNPIKYYSELNKCE